MEMKYFAIGCIWLGVGLCGVNKSEPQAVAFFAMFATLFVAIS